MVNLLDTSMVPNALSAATFNRVGYRTVMRILFVDDEPTHVDVVRRTLEDSLDADVVVADSVEAAVRLLHQSTFDLVVTDIFIPMGSRPREAIGPRSRRYEETVQHLG